MRGQQLDRGAQRRRRQLRGELDRPMLVAHEPVGGPLRSTPHRDRHAEVGGKGLEAGIDRDPAGVASADDARTDEERPLERVAGLVQRDGAVAGVEEQEGADLELGERAAFWVDEAGAGAAPCDPAGRQPGRGQRRRAASGGGLALGHPACALLERHRLLMLAPVALDAGKAQRGEAGHLLRKLKRALGRGAARASRAGIELDHHRQHDPA